MIKNRTGINFLHRNFKFLYRIIIKVQLNITMRWKRLSGSEEIANPGVDNHLYETFLI